tara:strand:+ start:810 stop:2534 length:1725 start_codon:yes stop_codon:yes gene_type:complete
MAFSVLHLSDLHFSNKHAAQHNLIRDAFWVDLNNQIQEHGKPNVVVFSGDVVNNPDEEDVYLHAIDKFFHPLAEKTGVKTSNFVFCPGNHDISRKRLKENSLLANGFREVSGNSGKINSLYNSNELKKFAFDVSSGFFEFCEYLGNPWSNPFFHNYKIADTNFVAINMAFSCTVDGSPSDRGKLIFPVAALEDALSANGSAHFFGLVGHFPIDEMNEAHAREIRPIAQSAAQCLFYGHVHNALPTITCSSSSGLIDLQSGALYAGGDSFKGYAFVEVEDNKTRARYRTYFDGRREFDEATNVGSGGLFYPDENSRSYWLSRHPDFSKSQLNDYLQNQVFKILEVDYKDTLSEQALLEAFVCPTFGEPTLISSDDSGDARDELRGEDELKATDEHLCCHFPDETGATSFLQYVSLLMAKQPSDFAVQRIPLIVDVRDVKSYPAAVLKSVKTAMPDSDHPQFGWKAREADHPFLVLVDNYNPNKTDHFEWLKATYKLLPKARFIVCVKSPFAAQQSKTRPQIDLPFAARPWLLYPFNRSEVRTLVNRFSLPDNLDRNLIVEEIISKFRVGPESYSF